MVRRRKAPPEILTPLPHIAYLFIIKAPLITTARDYAQQASKHCYWFMDEQAGGYVLRGVRWAAAMKDGRTVVAAVLDPTPKVLEWLRQNTTELEADQYYKEGRPVPKGHNGLP